MSFNFEIGNYEDFFRNLIIIVNFILSNCMKHLLAFLIMILMQKPLQAQEGNIVAIQKSKVVAIEKMKSSFQRDTLLALSYAKLAKLFVDESADSCMFYVKKAEIISAKYNFKKGLGHIEIAMGILNREQGHYLEALSHLNQAIGILKTIDEPAIAATYSAIGTIYAYTNQYQKAILYHKKSLDIYQRLGNKTGVIDNLANIGNAYLENNLFNKALPYFIKLENIYDKNPEDIEDLPGHKCVNYINLCSAYYQKDQMAKASVYEKLSIDYCKIINGISEKEYLLMQIAKYHIRKSNFDKANEYLLEAKTLAQTLGSDEKNNEISFQKYKIFKGKGNIDSALNYFENYTQIKDQLAKNKAEVELKYDNVEKQATINDLTSQKQNQIEKGLLLGITVLLFLVVYAIFNNYQLRRKNKEISEAMLKGQTTERKRVASDLHDNLGSTMSSIRWAFQAIDRTKWSDNEKEIFSNVQTMFDKAYDDIRLLSHNLLPEEFERLGLTTTLQNFIRKINKNTSIRFDLEVDEEFGRVDKKIEFELYSICLELVNNIMKHSKASEAIIELSRTKNQIKLVVADNGIGIFKNDSDGKGIKNVQSRVESLSGTWKIQNDENDGFMNEILVPI